MGADAEPELLSHSLANGGRIARREALVIVASRKGSNALRSSAFGMGFAEQRRRVGMMTYPALGLPLILQESLTGPELYRTDTPCELLSERRILFRSRTGFGGLKTQLEEHTCNAQS
jgi:hypothetical protein